MAQQSRAVMDLGSDMRSDQSSRDKAIWVVRLATFGGAVSALGVTWVFSNLAEAYFSGKPVVAHVAPPPTVPVAAVPVQAPRPVVTTVVHHAAAGQASSGGGYAPAPAQGGAPAPAQGGAPAPAPAPGAPAPAPAPAPQPPVQAPAPPPPPPPPPACISTPSHPC